MAHQKDLPLPHEVDFHGTMANTSSRVSSIYSRPAATESLVDASGLQSGELPQIFDLDIMIAEMGGSTMSLELRGSHLQKSKREQHLSPEQRRRELLWHGQESRFYERCCGIFNELRSSVEDIAQDLILQSYVESAATGNYHFRASLVKLRVALDKAQAELAEAKSDYKLFWASPSSATWV